jgi:hypothetical protein
MNKRKNYKNGKNPDKSVKPAERGICSECQYKIYEAVVDKVKVKEKDVFDKGTSRSQTQRSNVKSQRPKKNQNQNQKN